MSDGRNNIIDLSLYRATRTAASKAKRGAPGGYGKYMLWYPGAGVALIMQSASGHAAQFTALRNGMTPVPEGA